MNWEWEHIVGGIITLVIAALIGWLLYSQNAAGFSDGHQEQNQNQEQEQEQYQNQNQEQHQEQEQQNQNQEQEQHQELQQQ
jgi:uncharacterized protein (DUF697 family)